MTNPLLFKVGIVWPTLCATSPEGLREQSTSLIFIRTIRCGVLLPGYFLVIGVRGQLPSETIFPAGNFHARRLVRRVLFFCASAWPR